MYGHSHGGNVEILAIDLGLGRPVTNLITAGTPARGDYTINDPNSVKNWINVSNLQDRAQVSGGSLVFRAGREQEGAYNLTIDIDAGLLGSHSILHTPLIWNLVLPFLILEPTPLPPAPQIR